MSQDKNNKNDEPIIEVTATPVRGMPITRNYSLYDSSGEIAIENVPGLVSSNQEEAVKLATLFLDHIKQNYSSTGHELYVKVEEEEEIDRGWFSHIDLDLGGGIDFEGGRLDAKVKGTPKKEKRKKKTTIRVGVEKKEEKEKEE
jgi:hypothetical protein